MARRSRYWSAARWRLAASRVGRGRSRARSHRLPHDGGLLYCRGSFRRRLPAAGPARRTGPAPLTPFLRAHPGVRGLWPCRFVRRIGTHP
jgi:hypothetical protein